jgi:hypothetical protein
MRYFVGTRRVKAYLKYTNQGQYFKVVKKYKNKCRDCKRQDFLIVHHKDGNRKNNLLDNLVLLCKHCHAVEHGYTLTVKNPKLPFILELRQQGLTFQEIGYQLGVSRQRVHQIVAKIGGLTRTNLHLYSSK